MSGLVPLLDAPDLVPPLDDQEAEPVARELAGLSGLTVYPKSIAAKSSRVYFLARRNLDKLLCIIAGDDPAEFQGELSDCAHGLIKLCPTGHHNAVALRAALPYTRPRCVGDRLSFGTGDRLGLATPGHIRAVRGTGLVPILAQQSVREMTRTQRTPDDVMDDASWGVFEEGFRDGFGADADHLKNAGDITRTLDAGFCMFTIDPGDHVDNHAETHPPDLLLQKLRALPWDDLESSEKEYRNTFVDKTFPVGLDMELTFSEDHVLRAAAKYGRAVAHTVRLYRHLADASHDRPFELEISVDETDFPTTVHEHFYVAHELRRLGVNVVSLAPRFIGDFEKGIDYKGDLKAFEQSLIQHVKIAKHLGPYKISIHSGSDKFSIYPIAARRCGDLVHVKTAGTSYLEALRAVAEVEPDLFRDILAFAFERYDQDKASYHVSAHPELVPKPREIPDDKLPALLDGNDGRQMLHVTYGSVLTARDADGRCRFRDRLLHALRANEEVHYQTVARHLRRHIEPFVTKP